MNGRQNRNRRFGNVDASEDARALGNTRQTFVDDVGAEVHQVQVDVVAVGANTTTGVDFHGHGTRDDVARGEVFGVRRITLHKALAFGVGQVTTFTTHAFGDQHARAVDAGRVELNEFHVLQRQAGTQYHRVTVTGTGVCRRGGEVRTTATTGGQYDRVSTEAVHFASGQIDGNHTTTSAFFVHDQINGEVLDVELSAVTQRLLIERVQDCVTGTVSRGASALGDTFTEVGGHTTEGALVDFAFFCARERHTVVLQFDYRRNGFTTHILDGVLVAEPVGTFDGVVHVPLPVVGAHVAE